MLRNTFCHIPSITATDERNLWAFGISNWESCTKGLLPNLPKYKQKNLDEYVTNSKDHLESINPNYFAELLKPKDHWRLFTEFRNTTAYLDIETTGLTEYDKITTIVLYNGKEIYTFVRGRNLESFMKEIVKYKMLVTYNGKCFDITFIKRELGIEFNHVHLDLRYILFSLGYKGGLKICEKKLGINRNDLENIDGFFAVVLWEEFKKSQNEEILNTLLAYNIEDVINLEKLMVMAYNLKLENTPFNNSMKLIEPERPEISLKPNINLVNKIRYERMARIRYY